jgi:hypothetical protein
MIFEKGRLMSTFVEIGFNCIQDKLNMTEAWSGVNLNMCPTGNGKSLVSARSGCDALHAIWTFPFLPPLPIH